MYEKCVTLCCCEMALGYYVERNKTITSDLTTVGFVFVFFGDEISYIMRQVFSSFTLYCHVLLFFILILSISCNFHSFDKQGNIEIWSGQPKRVLQK